MDRIGFARKSSFAVGESSGGEGEFGEAEEGMAIKMEVRVERRGIDAERRERRAVWRRWGRITRLWRGALAFFGYTCARKGGYYSVYTS